MDRQDDVAASAHRVIGVRRSGRTLVNVPREDFARVAQTPGFVVGTLGRWLDECSEDEAHALVAGGGGSDIPQAVLDSIRAMEDTGQQVLVEQATALRRQFVPVDLEDLRARVEAGLGFDPLGDDGRGRLLAEQVGVYERVLALPKLTLARLRQNADGAGRASRYESYPGALRRRGFTRMVHAGQRVPGHVPVDRLHTRRFRRARRRPCRVQGARGRGRAVTNLLYASPTETEALVFALDRERVARWLVANKAATESELRDAGGAHRWFAGQLDPEDGQLPRWDPDEEVAPGDPEFGARSLFQLLHSTAHQLLRALAVDSGYSETGLSEYLFPYELSFAIHPNGGSEFTIGGLRTVLEQNLDEVVDRAVENSSCIYDPNCMVANRGADHGCSSSRKGLSVGETLHQQVGLISVRPTER